MAPTHRSLPLLFQIPESRPLWRHDLKFRGCHEEIMKALRFDPSNQPGDLDGILLSTGDFLATPLKLFTPRVTYVRESGNFRSFDSIKFRGPSLLVNNDDESTCEDEVSSLSNLLPLYAKQLLDRSITPITYSAGFHTDSEHPWDRGCWGLLRSLNIQLLLVFGDQLDLSIIRGADLDKIERGDTYFLCWLLHDIMAGVVAAGHECKVTCIIDGVQFLEQDYDGFSSVFRLLQETALGSKKTDMDRDYIFRVLYIHGGISKFESVIGLGTWTVPKKRVRQAIERGVQQGDPRIKGELVDEHAAAGKSKMEGKVKAHATEPIISWGYGDDPLSAVRRCYFGKVGEAPDASLLFESDSSDEDDED